MTSKELVTFMDQLVQVLELNRKLATIPTLSFAKSAVNKVREQEKVVTGICQLTGVDSEKTHKLIDSLAKGIDLEFQVIGGELDFKAITLMKRLKHRPLLLKTIAALI